MSRLNFKFIYNEEAERSLLIQILVNPNKLFLCSKRISIEAIYNDVYKSIYSSCLKCNQNHEDNSKIGLDEIAKELELEWDNSDSCLKNLKNFVLEGASMSFEEAVRKIEISYLKRRLIDLFQESQNQILAAFDVQKAVQYVCEKAFEMISENSVFSQNQLDPIREIVDEISSGYIHDNFLPTGLFNLDSIIAGISKQHITIVAARPSIGKTSFVCTLLENLLQKGRNCIFFSLETSVRYVLYRLLTIRTNLTQDQIIHQKLSEAMKTYLANDILLVKNWMQKENLQIIDKSLSISEIDYHITKYLHVNKNLDVVFIDYLQIISLNPNRPTYIEIGEILRKLKQIAKEKNIAIIVLSQLNRAIESREGAPKQSDLAYSGSIEMVSDLILMLSRSEEEAKHDLKFIDITISKNRNGRIGKARVLFDPVTGKFKDFRNDQSDL